MPSSPPRRCTNWLDSLLDLVEETESPRRFWLWTGISTIASALQRRVWLPFGLETQYPNLYILIVAPPGVCRKGPTVSLAKDMLTKLGLSVFVDSPTKRALTKYMDKLSNQCHFKYAGQPMPQCPPILISKELSSFFAVDPKAMIEVLTDLYDSHDVWEYVTSGEGKDKILGTCVNCLFATTPRWMAANLPEEAIGGGFTSRFVLVGADTRYKSVSLPPPLDQRLYKDLLLDLGQISQLVGQFKWGEGAFELYDQWYKGIGDNVLRKIKDERLHGNVHRMHTIALKVAMTVSCAENSTLVITPSNMEQAITLLTNALMEAKHALGAHGRSKTGIDTDKILRDLNALYPGDISFAELLQHNIFNTNGEQLTQILEDCVAMGRVESRLVGEERYFKYKKGEKNG